VKTQQERRREFEARGLCKQCGKAKPTEGRKTCEPCRNYVAAKCKRWLDKHPEWKPKAQELSLSLPMNCARCGVAVKSLKGQKRRLCQPCASSLVGKQRHKTAGQGRIQVLSDDFDL
jgi:DNA-directed RNA polymerase subunit RPC12/RpoP